ncbi:collagen alpha-2(I) chain-like [Alexandromys fortis]|uniref:collagen alpha-2(I) chain-like n=1 Tax=Alexandromys fortis TaxID=100897 RepID=UPI0021532CB8|nr:collagen alpha-2(I) chain-like [Microtus fortis]
MELQSLEFAPLVFSLALVRFFLIMFLFLAFRMVTYILLIACWKGRGERGGAGPAKAQATEGRTERRAARPAPVRSEAWLGRRVVRLDPRRPQNRGGGGGLWEAERGRPWVRGRLSTRGGRGAGAAKGAAGVPTPPRGRCGGGGAAGRGLGGGAAGAGPIGPRGSGRGGAGAVPASPAGERVEAASLCGWLSRRRSRRRGAPRPRPAAPSRNELQESAGHSGPKAEAEKRETSKKVSPRGARARHRPAPPRRGLLAAAQAELPGPRAAGLPGRGAGSACPGGGGVGEGRAAAGSGAATWPGGLRAARAPRSIPRLAPLSHTRDPHLRPCPAAVGWGAGEGGGGALTAGLREPVRCRLCHLPVPPQPSS